MNNALQIYGGYGYLQDYPIEQYLRDIRVCIRKLSNGVKRYVATECDNCAQGLALRAQK